MKKFENHRMKFIGKYNLKLKVEFWHRTEIEVDKKDFKIG